MKPGILYGFKPNIYTQTAIACCYELNLNFELQALEFGKETHLALHPFGKMPVLKDGDFVIYETLATCIYLQSLAREAFGEDALNLIQAHRQTKATIFTWCSNGIDYLYNQLVRNFLEERPDSIMIKRYWEILDKQLQNTPYLASSAVSIADLLIAPMVIFVETKLGKQTFDRYKALADWHNAMKSRPSLQEACK